MASKKQHRKQRENIGSRTLHGSILEGLGRLLGAIGALLGAMIAFLGRSWALLGRLFGLMGASGLIWGGFGRLLGGSWEVLGRILEEFWEDFGRISSFQRPPRCLANSLGVTIGSAGRITGQTVPGSTVQRQPLQQCAKISSENRALFFEMPPSFKILKCNWMWPGRAGLVHPSFLIVL